MKKTYLLGASVVLLSVVGCASSGKSSSDTADGSVVQGTLALTSFPSRPDSVEAVDESGAAITTQPGDDGAFNLRLPKGHTYTIDIMRGSDSEPVVFPRKDGSLTATFDVTSGGATVELGTIRHFDEAPQGGFSVRGTPEGHAADSECEEGVVPSTGAACVDDDAAPVCGGRSEADKDAYQAGKGDDAADVDVEADDADGDAYQGGKGDDAADIDVGADDADGDAYQGGKGDGAADIDVGADDADGDAYQGGKEDDAADIGVEADDADGDAYRADDEANETDRSGGARPVDRSKPMAIPEHNVPAQLGGCDGKDGDRDGDGDGDSHGDSDGDDGTDSADDSADDSANEEDAQVQA